MRKAPKPGSLDEHMTEMLISDLIFKYHHSPESIKALRPDLSHLVDKVVRQGGPTPGYLDFGLSHNPPPTVQPPTAAGAEGAEGAAAAAAMEATASPAVAGAVAAASAAALRPALENMRTQLEARLNVADAALGNCLDLRDTFRTNLKKKREDAGGIGIPRDKAPGEPDCTAEHAQVNALNAALHRVNDLLKP